jgi:hypothetical protein
MSGITVSSRPNFYVANGRGTDCSGADMPKLRKADGPFAND